MRWCCGAVVECCGLTSSSSTALWLRITGPGLAVALTPGSDWRSHSHTACNLVNPNWIRIILFKIERRSLSSLAIETYIERNGWERQASGSHKSCVWPGLSEGPGDLWYPGTGYQQLGRVLVAAKMCPESVCRAYQDPLPAPAQVAANCDKTTGGAEEIWECWCRAACGPGELAGARAGSCQGVFAPKYAFSEL